MAKNKETKKVEEVKAEIPVVEVVEEKVSKKEVEFPQIAGNGKFQAVQVEAEFVVYNPNGQRASGFLTKQQADDIVREQNLAAHLK